MAAETLAYSTAANKLRDRRRRRRKQKRNNKDGGVVKENTTDSQQQVVEQVEIEYVPEKADLAEEGFDEEFRKIFDKFSFKFLNEIEDNNNNDTKAENATTNKKAQDSDSEEDQKQKGGVSNKKKKRMTIAELKQVSSRPDVVEVWDATAPEPKLLVFLKSYRNTVPVPRHWSQKRKFLQGKRGIEKKPFQLPDFIAATGIENIRQAYIEKEDNKNLKQKQRERMRPKMGMQLYMDVLVLHDAFFKYQTKPNLSSLGDLYHEGKEFEVKLRRELKPCMLSRELKEALGMPEEGASPPPPWLLNMQRYGPPPSYPHLKIPGLNAPIPSGGCFGYHPGGWGKPPVDEYGRPLYGDVFGVHQPNYEEEQVDKSKKWWGGMEEKKEEMKEEEEEEEEEELEAGIQSVVDSLSSTPTRVETPDVIDLRKQKRKEPERRPLYQVLEEKEEKLAPVTLLGTTHTYVVGTSCTQDKAGATRVDLLKSQKSDEVDVNLQPEELDVMENVLSAKYEEAREEENLRSRREDFSDMVAENEKKRKRKMLEKEGKSKKKVFKF